uniref:Uncharacterized protein n=1 Tax=Plectus sambesii TaxID=2011161 RepID=A0A914X3U0_9BILA
MALPPPMCVSVIMNGDEKRVTVRNLKPSHIAMMYSLDPDTVWLVDSQNLVCMQSPDCQSFEDVDPSQGPFTVLGNPLQSLFVPPLPPMPSINHR